MTSEFDNFNLTDEDFQELFEGENMNEDDNSSGETSPRVLCIYRIVQSNGKSSLDIFLGSQTFYQSENDKAKILFDRIKELLTSNKTMKDMVLLLLDNVVVGSNGLPKEFIVGEPYVYHNLIYSDEGKPVALTMEVI